MNTNNKYNIAVFEENDSADLIEYSEKMKETIETALDNNKGEKGDTGPAPIKGTDYFTNEEIQEIENNVLDRVNQFSVEVVEILPSENISEHTIYFIPQKNAKQQDVYDEYMFINGNWEHIGTTEVDLSNYYNKEEVDEKVEVAGDSLPVGTIVEYEGETVPEGYEEVEENERKIYSTEEQVVGKWVDGKKLYRKVMLINNSNEDYQTIPHNISNISEIIKIDGTAFSATGNALPIPTLYISNSTSTKDISYFTINMNLTNIVIIKQSINILSVKVIFEYTKTTD